MSDFFADHPMEGAWKSLKGGMFPAPELMTLESKATGDSRHQTNAVANPWEKDTIVQTPTTTGTGSTNAPLAAHE
jgi:hypothetical protein